MSDGWNEDVEISEPVYIGKIRRLSDDGYRIHYELPNAQNGSATRSDRPFPFSVGDVIAIGEGTVELAEAELWRDDQSVAVVKMLDGDLTIVDNGSLRWRTIPTNRNVKYEVDNTVLIDDFVGVIKVLKDTPVKFIGDNISDLAVSKFKHEPKEPLTFDDFGGLDHVKDRARELIEIPILYHDQYEAIGARPIKGVLFTGEPGTGKTMLARIIASQAKAEFYRISGPEIFSKWYGESEELLRRIFDDAKKQEPSIIFFDEIDSVAGRREGDTHEASRRVVAQLLTLMDGFDSSQNVVVIAATNRPDDIDRALLRPGRFDWIIEFPLPNLNDREAILATSVKRIQTEGPLPHDLIAMRTEDWNAAELDAIWSEAALFAVADGRNVVLAEDYLGGFERVAAQRNLGHQLRIVDS